MSSKRMMERNVNDAVIGKIPKISEEDIDFPDDRVFDCSNLSDVVKTSLTYDSVLKEFVIGIEKKRETDSRSISLGQGECAGVVKLLPAVFAIVERYEKRRAPKPVDVPFEVNQCTVGDMVTVLFAKESVYKRGKFDIDLRKCIKNRESAYTYTTEGIRVNTEMGRELRAKLLYYLSTIEKMAREERKTLKMANVCLLIKEIRDMAVTQIQCAGCQIQHPSQKQHMGFGGCLSVDTAEEEERMSWDEMVDQYWRPAYAIVTVDDVIKVANMAAEAVMEPDAQVLCVIFYFFLTMYKCLV